jgi:hypothetical protein
LSADWATWEHENPCVIERSHPAANTAIEHSRGRPAHGIMTSK